MAKVNKRWLAVSRKHVVVKTSQLRSRYKVKLAGGEFYKLMERRDKPVKIKGKQHTWKTIAIGTKRLYAIADALNMVHFD